MTRILLALLCLLALATAKCWAKVRVYSGISEEGYW